MKSLLLKYRNLLLVLLVCTVNLNYAVTIGLCAMGMDHESECCCTQPVPCKDNNEVTFNEVNCCTEFTTEFSSSADFEILKKLELNELILLFSIDISQDITHNHPSTLFYTPNKIEFSSSGDIPIRHSSLLI